ncbi:uncharacterized protein LOC120358842 [Solenopsis invicta]|uniref:uncharacterized protein LOC120358842 n=1 Tax=Solenopsis invicta TaxID=13686 RepID=UPI00193E5814|nr:uncharacterized protein LOC120358842 [Solenopsis invicta]
MTYYDACFNIQHGSGRQSGIKRVYVGASNQRGCNNSIVTKSTKGPNIGPLSRIRRANLAINTKSSVVSKCINKHNKAYGSQRLQPAYNQYTRKAQDTAVITGLARNSQHRQGHRGQHSYVIGADITMMYRQVLVEPSQRAYQRILWREDSSHCIDTYELNTVTYGMASSPFLAIKCLFSLADKHQETYPKAATIIRKFMYVDDLLFGASSKEEDIQLAKDVSYILSSGCFELRKWISNEPQILEDIGISNSDQQVIEIGEAGATKTLGLSWLCTNDELIYYVKLELDKRPATKRTMLSVIARLFDSIGLIGPCIIITKVMLQKLWKLKLSWDDELPVDLQSEWSQFLKELTYINDIRIPRQICCSSPQCVQIHGFSDASEAAYGGCIYIRSVNTAGSTFVQLLCARSRVAPLKPLTMPKLELSAAHLFVKLIAKIKTALDLNIDSVHYWSDSTFILSWIRFEPHRLQTFVRNRVTDIQALSSASNWKHIPSSENPADLLSRGVSPRTLTDSNLWWHGPTWLAESEDQWPTQNNDIPINLPEVKESRLKISVLHSQRGGSSSSQNHANKISTTGIVPEEIHALSIGKIIGTRNKISSLNPFLHKDNTLRVGGRLRHADFDFDKKHPIILAAKHPLKLIFEDEHKRLLHLGPQALLSQIREKYWPIADPKESQMADLPHDRVSPTPVFYNVGTDYTGPFIIKDRKGRGCKTHKAYICLFICMATKAIHLELVSDLTSENFILALRRFTARRGRPGKISSDNGTNFVGACSELKLLGEFLTSNEGELQNRLVSEGINWSFIPAYAPHFGGIWEAGIKSTKYHLQRVIGKELLTFEEFYSLLTQIEAILNSRPLSLMSSHPMDLQPLTPAHFIVGRTLTTVPCPDLTDVNQNRLSRYQRIQQMQQNFWKRWSKEFVSELQCRSKWKSNIGALKVGDLVLVKDDNAPPLHWQLGRVSELYPGADSVKRAATIRTSEGVVRRAVVKLSPLPIETKSTNIRIDQSNNDKLQHN